MCFFDGKCPARDGVEKLQKLAKKCDSWKACWQDGPGLYARGADRVQNGVCDCPLPLGLCGLEDVAIDFGGFSLAVEWLVMGVPVSNYIARAQ